MAKYDLSSAIDYASQLPEVKYSNIGTLAGQMQLAGFDPKIAKMALMLVFKENPDIKTHLKSGGVNALQAAKALFEANIEFGDILDKLLQMGYLRDEAVDAIKSINLDEGDQDVNKFTEKPHEDNSYADYADEGYIYDDIPPQAVKELIDFAEENKSNMNPETLRDILEKYDVSQNSISQLNKELFAKEASFEVKKFSVEMSWRDVGLALQDAEVDHDQIITILKENGASDEEAAAAALPREGQESEEDNMSGAPSDAPEDLDLGPSGDFPYSAGMDLDGPGGLNDSLEGAPGPNDFSGTGGGYMGAPSDVADGDFFADAPSGSGSGGGNHFEDMAKDYIAKDPQMTKGDIVELLKNEGADKQEADEVADKLNIEDDPSIRPGVFVRAGVGVGRVSSVWDTMYGKMANVISDKDGMEYEFLVEDIEILDEQKTSSVEDDLFVKITNHLSGDWYDSLEKTSGDYRDTYSSRIKTARSLLSEINTRLATTKDIGEMGLLTEARSAIDNEILFCQAKLTNTDFMGEEEYVNSRPKYEFAREASLGNAIGPGGGESMVLIAEDMEREAAATNWNDLLITDSIEFVNNLSPSLIGDAQEVARIAFSEFAPKVASVEDGKRQDLISEFMKNVEDVRRRVVADSKEWDKPWTEKDESKEEEPEEDDKEKKDETTKNNYKKNKEEGMKALQKKRDYQQGKDLSNPPIQKNKPMGYSPKVEYDDDDDPAKYSKSIEQDDEGWLL